MNRLAHPVAVSESPQEYSIQAIRYGMAEAVRLSDLVVEGGRDEVEVAMVFWLIRGGGRTILFDTGYHRQTFARLYSITDYVRPDEAVRQAGVEVDEVTDVVLSHAHWDHMGGLDLFPGAQVWVQRAEFGYYTTDAWQPNGNRANLDAADVIELVRANTEGRVHLLEGDDVEIFRGIRAFTGSRHTFASQYLQVTGTPTWVLASDSVYFFLNLDEHLASATFSEADHAANIAQHARMIELAGSPDRILPGHDPLQFARFPTHGRVATIK